jgi:hypothetical protein
MAGIGRFRTTSKGSTMDARFLRDEAARSRGMADDADRESTKHRLLAMAADYEARARVANELAEPNLSEIDQEAVAPNLAGAITGLDEPMQDEPPKITPGRKVARGLKETVLIERRPVGRPRRE